MCAERSFEMCAGSTYGPLFVIIIGIVTVLLLHTQFLPVNPTNQG